ncbi:MAG: hypothetical protein AB8G86_09465 [Saprospiraceae bacterium]
MKTIPTQAGQVKIEEVLKGISQLQITDLEGFVNQALKILEKRKAPEKKKKEKALIHQIKNGGPSEDFWKKYDSLYNKLESETMTEIENQEFLKLTEITGKWAVERTKLMIELAKLWNTSLKEVRIRLKIKPRESIYA